MFSSMIKSKLLMFVLFQTPVLFIRTEELYLNIKSVVLIKTNEKNASEQYVFNNPFLLHAIINKDKYDIFDFFLYKTIEELYIKKENDGKNHDSMDFRIDLMHIKSELLRNELLFIKGNKELVEDYMYISVNDIFMNSWKWSIYDEISENLDNDSFSVEKNFTAMNKSKDHEIKCNRGGKYYSDLVFSSFPRVLKGIIVKNLDPDYEALKKKFKFDLENAWCSSSRNLDFKSFSKTSLPFFEKSETEHAYEISVYLKYEPPYSPGADKYRHLNNSFVSGYYYSTKEYDKTYIGYLIRIKIFPNLLVTLEINKTCLLSEDVLENSTNDDPKLEFCNRLKRDESNSLIEFLKDILEVDCSQSQYTSNKNTLNEIERCLKQSKLFTESLTILSSIPYDETNLYNAIDDILKELRQSQNAEAGEKNKVKINIDQKTEI